MSGANFPDSRPKHLVWSRLQVFSAKFELVGVFTQSNVPKPPFLDHESFQEMCPKRNRRLLFKPSPIKSRVQVVKDIIIQLNISQTHIGTSRSSSAFLTLGHHIKTLEASARFISLMHISTTPCAMLGQTPLLKLKPEIQDGQNAISCIDVIFKILQKI